MIGSTPRRFARPNVVLAVVGLTVPSAVLLCAWEQDRPAVIAGDDVPKPSVAPLDPTAWGTDHVGQPVPEYITGGECLFCHRSDIGESWSTDRHNRTIRPAPDTTEIRDDAPAYLARDADAMSRLRRDDDTADIADDVELLLGDARSLRFLRWGEKYGTAEMLSVAAHARRGRRYRLYHDTQAERGRAHFHDAQHFASRCAGCHTTAVDPNSLAFAATGLDCYTCHGTADEEHANDPALILLAEAREDPPRVVVSLCGSCHIRHGRSRSTHRRFANNFVPGDNLFRDLEVDFAAADAADLNPIDRHVLVNVREVVVEGSEVTTCLTCHDVHARSTRRHRDLADTEYCALCHDPDEPKKRHRVYEVHSDVCHY